MKTMVVQDRESTASKNGAYKNTIDFLNDPLKLFGELRSKFLMRIVGTSDKITILKKFCENHLTVDAENIDSAQILSMCKYYEALNEIIREFESRLDQLNEDHAEVQKIRTDAESIEDCMKLGNSYFKLNKYCEAVECYTLALETNLPSNFVYKSVIILRLLYNRALANSEIGSYRRAIEDCNRALQIDPFCTNALLLRTHCYECLEEFEKCIQEYERVLFMKEIRECKEKARAVHLKLEEMTIRLRHKRAQDINTRADKHYHDGNYRLAEKLYTNAINVWPGNCVFYGNRCKTLISLENFKGALDDSRIAVEIDDNYMMGYEYIARCCFIFGEYDEAERAIERLIQNSHEEEKYGELKEIYTKLRECDGNAVQSYINEDFRSAIEHAKRGLEILPQSICFKLCLAECYMYEGEEEEIGKLEDARGLSEADQLYVKGLKSFTQGNVDEALSHLNKGIEMDSSHRRCKYMQKTFSNIDAKKSKGDDLFGEKKFHEAIENYTEALECFNKPHIVFRLDIIRQLYYSRAMAHSKVGNFLSAIDDYMSVDTILLVNGKDVSEVLLRTAECYHYLDDIEYTIVVYERALMCKGLKANTTKFEMITTKVDNLKEELKHKTAQKLIVCADKHHKKKNYEEALKKYSEAISLWPENLSFYKARIECLMKTKDFMAAIEDCRTAISFDSTNFHAYDCMIQCYLALGDTDSADAEIQKYFETGSKSYTIDGHQKRCREFKRFEENAKVFSEKGEFQLALNCVDDALEIAHANFELKLLKAEYLATLERFQEADEIATSCMELNPSNVDASYIHALCIYHTNWEQGLECFQSVIALDADHKRSKAMILKIEQFEKQEQIVNKLLEDEKYREAKEKITEVLEISPHSNVPKLLRQRAIANSKTGQFRDAISDCSTAMETSYTDYSKCLQMRGDCWMAVRKFKNAVVDYELLFKKFKLNEAENLLRKAKCALQRFQSDNYYDVLDVNRTASTDEIKKSFKKLALIHHPDKHSDASNEEKIEQQNQFKKISVAHEVLSNSAKRDDYDRKYRKTSYFH
ncbi:uncharacterized protein LOC129567864 [Sitodiplosis mosellana]|uniref:uncharacterized protein LOC129567864 n=1 Tax=Sitodiplosis mosellana TaxID=263140 RepID=UPI00244391B9|nr:uncharacterized protein LOC129567864 [Sitodiplosis mosellana]